MRRFPLFCFTALAVLQAGAAAAAPLPADMIGFQGRLLRSLAPHHMAGAAQTTTPPLTLPNYTFFDYPSTPYTGAYGINLGAKPAPTRIVGSFGPGLSDYVSAVYGFELELKSKKNVTSFNYAPVLPGPSQVAPFGINDSGTIAGSITDSNNVTTGFIEAPNGKLTSIVAPYQGAQDTSVEGITDAGVAVGEYYVYDSLTVTAFTWHKGTFTQLPNYAGSTYTWPYGINNAGDTTGDIIDAGGVTHGYLFANNSFTLIDPPGSVYTIAIGINDSDEIVGFYCTDMQSCSISGPDNIHGFLYSNGQYTTIDVPGSPWTELASINDAGTIVGNYTDQNTLIHSFYITPNITPKR